MSTRTTRVLSRDTDSLSAASIHQEVDLFNRAGRQARETAKQSQSALKAARTARKDAIALWELPRVASVVDEADRLTAIAASPTTLAFALLATRSGGSVVQLREYQKRVYLECENISPHSAEPHEGDQVVAITGNARGRAVRRTVTGLASVATAFEQQYEGAMLEVVRASERPPLPATDLHHQLDWTIRLRLAASPSNAEAPANEGVVPGEEDGWSIAQRLGLISATLRRSANQDVEPRIGEELEAECYDCDEGDGSAATPARDGALAVQASNIDRPKLKHVRCGVCLGNAWSDPRDVLALPCCSVPYCATCWHTLIERGIAESDVSHVRCPTAACREVQRGCGQPHASPDFSSLLSAMASCVVSPRHPPPILCRACAASSPRRASPRRRSSSPWPMSLVSSGCTLWPRQRWPS